MNKIQINVKSSIPFKIRRVATYWFILVFIVFSITVLNSILPRRKHIICDKFLVGLKDKGIHTTDPFLVEFKAVNMTRSNFYMPAKILDMRNVSRKSVTNVPDWFPSVLKQKDITTIVTAYFNLGRFKKTESFFSALYYNRNKYHRWASVFKFIVNPLVIYTDSDDFVHLMSKVREDLGLKTVILKIERRDVWAFRLYGDICAIFQQPDYPLIMLNTERPDYSCAMHSKYELVGDASRRNLFDTEFYQWLDIGYFRDIFSEKKYFRMNLPVNFDHTKVAFNKVRNNPMTLKPDKIIKENLIWVEGGIFFGRRDVLLKFEYLYKKATEYFISQNLINTDQQMLYAIYSEEGRKVIKPDVDIQVFIPEKDSKVDPWFFLDICAEKS